MFWNLFLLIIGLTAVCKGGDLFVDSSVHIASRLRVPRIVIGGTLVSLATTMPELIVSVTASLMKDPGIALGNAVGSAIGNIGLILGLSALFVPLVAERSDFRRRSAWMVVSAFLLVLFSWDLQLTRFLAFVLFLLSAAYLFFDYLNVRRHRSSHAAALAETIEAASPVSMKKDVMVFAAGAALVVIGSKMLVQSAIAIANALGIPSVVIGLSIVAVGTSLPELVTAMAAVRKGVHDLSLGNIIGANVLNMTLIVGISGMVHPLTVAPFTRAYSYSWLFVFVLLVVGILGKRGTMGRKSGMMFLALYGMYIAGLVAAAFAH